MAARGLAWSVSGALVCACIPPEPPEWVVTQPVVRGIQTAVVERGPYSKGLLVPLGQTRTSPLPLDTVELRWFVAAPEGEVVRAPIWVLCSGDCVTFGLADGVGECPRPMPLQGATPCRLGEGVRVRLPLGGLDTFTGSSLDQGGLLWTVVSIGSFGASDPETCLKGLSSPVPPGLEECLIGQHFVLPGPEVRLRWLFPWLFDSIAPPPEAFQEPPDTNPVIVWFTVADALEPEVPPRLALDGATVEVRAGEPLRVGLQLNANAEEWYYDWQKSDEGAEEPVIWQERLRARVSISADVEAFEASFEPPFEFRWVAPASPETVTLWVEVRDTRQGVAFGALHLRSVDAPGEAP